MPLECAYARRIEIRPPSGWRRPPGVQGRLGFTRLVIAPQPAFAKNWTLQSDVDIPDERDRQYGPPPPRRSVFWWWWWWRWWWWWWSIQEVYSWYWRCAVIQQLVYWIILWTLQQRTVSSKKTNSPVAGPHIFKKTLHGLLEIISLHFSIVLSVSMKFSPGGASPPTWLFQNPRWPPRWPKYSAKIYQR